MANQKHQHPCLFELSVRVISSYERQLIWLLWCALKMNMMAYCIFTSLLEDWVCGLSVLNLMSMQVLHEHY